MSMVEVRSEQDSHHSYEECLHRLGVESIARCLLIIDAAQYDEDAVLSTLYATCDNPNWCWLFGDSVLGDHASAGPIVVETTAESALVMAVNDRYAGSGLVHLFTESPMVEALTGWRKALHGQLPTRGPSILRSYDSRFLSVMSACWPEWLASLVSPDTTVVWSVDWLDEVQWMSGFVSRPDSKRPEPVFDERFEVILSWTGAWDRLQRISGYGGTPSLRDRLAFVHHQYRRSIPCPTQDDEMAGQWRAFIAQQDLHGTDRRDSRLNEKDIEPCQR